jgi:hypothetical protein
VAFVPLSQLVPNLSGTNNSPLSNRLQGFPQAKTGNFKNFSFLPLKHKTGSAPVVAKIAQGCMRGQALNPDQETVRPRKTLCCSTATWNYPKLFPGPLGRSSNDYLDLIIRNRIFFDQRASPPHGVLESRAFGEWK